MKVEFKRCERHQEDPSQSERDSVRVATFQPRPVHQDSWCRMNGIPTPIISVVSDIADVRHPWLVRPGIN